MELTGDPEALVSGLTKLYAAARLPRRIATPQDRAASHPSLSRRIRDIRRAAGVQPTPLGEAVTIYSCDGSSVVSFEEAGLSWQQDAGVTQVIDYSHLHELRLDVGRRRGPHLVAVSDRHRSWEMRVSAADVPRLQAVLDRVDGRLGDALAPRGVSPVFSRCLVAVLSLLALSVSQLTVAVVVLLASLRPARPLIGGAAAAAFAAALLVVRDGRLAWRSGGVRPRCGRRGPDGPGHRQSSPGVTKRPAPCRRAQRARRDSCSARSCSPASTRSGCTNPQERPRRSRCCSCRSRQHWRGRDNAAPGSQPRQWRCSRSRPLSSRRRPSSMRSGEIRFSSTLRPSSRKRSMRRRSIGFRFPKQRPGSCSRPRPVRRGSDGPGGRGQSLDDVSCRASRRSFDGDRRRPGALRRRRHRSRRRRR